MANAAKLSEGPAPLPGQADAPYILVFDMDDTIVAKLPREFWSRIFGKVVLTPDQIAEMRGALIPPILDVLIRAAELRDREDPRVESIFLLTNNANTGFVKALDQLLLDIAKERLENIKPRTPLHAENSPLGLPNISEPVFFDAILMRQDPQRRPTPAEWKNSPKNWVLPEKDANGKVVPWNTMTNAQIKGRFSYATPGYNPSKNMSDVAVMSLLHNPRRLMIEEMLPRILFFDDFPDHKFKTQISSSQYIVVKRDPEALAEELGKLPAELVQPLGMPQGGGRRRLVGRPSRRIGRIQKRTRRRVQHSRTRRTKVYARRH